MSVLRRILFFSDEDDGNSGGLVTIVGKIVSFIAKKVTPIEELKVSIEPVQSGSGDPSPTNVRPITGWTGCEVRHTEANLLGGDALKDAVVAGMPSATVDTTNKYVSFSSTASQKQAISTPLNGKFKENTQYTLVITMYKTSGTGSNMRVYYTDGTYEAITGVSAAGEKETKVFITEENKTVLSISKTNMSGYTRIYYEESGIFEGVLTAEDFEAYQGTTYPISWQTEAGTVYGGTHDAVNGELTSTKGKIVLNGNETETWTAVNGAFYTRALPGEYALNSQDDWICNKYKPAEKIPKSDQIVNRDNLTVFNQSNYERRIFIKDTSITSVADLQTSLASAPVEIVFTLPTSSEHTVTPVSVSTLAGENNIWADCGDVTVTAAGIKEITPSSAQALNMLLGGMYTNNHTSDDVSDDEALDIILGGSNA